MRLPTAPNPHGEPTPDLVGGLFPVPGPATMGGLTVGDAVIVAWCWRGHVSRFHPGDLIDVWCEDGIERFKQPRLIVKTQQEIDDGAADFLQWINRLK